MRAITDFVNRFGTSLELDESLIAEKQGRFFLLNSNLKKSVSKDFFYAGTYLGKVKRGVFFPSFNLLAMIAQKREANKTMIDDRTEWLFIVGRDIFKQGIIEVTGSRKRGAHTLIVNQRNECLGFGRIQHDLNKKQNKRQVAVKNISDIGDFLRRERPLKD